MKLRPALALTGAAALAASAACSRGAPERRPEHPIQAATPAPAEPERIDPARLSPDQVRLLQRALAGRGFAVEVNGRYDAATEAALTDFKRIRGLPPGDALGASALESLGLDARDLAPAAPSR